MLMLHPEHGWHNAMEHELSAMQKAGWLLASEEVRQEIINAKHARPEVKVTEQINNQPATKRLGRPPKAA